MGERPDVAVIQTLVGIDLSYLSRDFIYGRMDRYSLVV